MPSTSNLATLQSSDQSDIAVHAKKNNRGEASGDANASWVNLKNAQVEKQNSRFKSLPDLSNVAQQRLDPRLPCYLTEPGIQTKIFFGRDNILEMLEEALLPPVAAHKPKEKKPRTFALRGIGGVGKTSIAAQFVASHETKFDAILWLRADTSVKVTDRFAQFAVKLGLQEAADARDTVISQKLVMKWLSNPLKSYTERSPLFKEKAHWLIVFDNVDDSNILQNFWPSHGTGSILITSRDPLAVNPAIYPGIDLENHGMQLTPFASDEATRFLREAAPDGHDPDDPDSTKRLADRLDGLPLALVQMAGIVTHRDLSFADFLELYDEEDSLLGLHQSSNPTRTFGYEYNLATVWALDKLQGGALALMNVVSLLDPDHIDEYILVDGSNRVDDDEYPKSLNAYQIARTKLWQTSLLSRDRKSKSLNIHRVVQDAARARMNRDQSRAAFQAATALLLAVWPSKDRLWLHTVTDWPQCDSLFPHIARLNNFCTKSNNYYNDIQGIHDFARLLTISGW